MFQKNALNHFLVHFSAKKTVSEVLKTCYFPYSAFWSTGQWGGGGGGGALIFLSGYATEKHNDCCPTRQHLPLIALFEVLYNSRKIILP